MSPMSHDDLMFITCSLYPDLKRDLIEKMIAFNEKVPT